MDLIAATDSLRRNPWLSYPVAIAAVGVTLAIRFSIGEALNGFPFLTFLPAILISSFLGGMGPGIVAACLTGYLVQKYFLPPIGSVWPGSIEQWVGLSVFILNAVAMVGLMCVILASYRKLAELRARLAEFNHTLEGMVEERTAALKKEVAEHEASQAQLRQLQKMETIGHLTGGVAHDFNNMLAIIIGSINLAERRLVGTEDPRLVGSLKNAKDGAQRAAVLTARLLAFSRRQPLAPEAIDANKLVGGMSELLRRSLSENVRIETVLAGGLWSTFADLSQLENAILNLAVNARDAMPDGGNLTIETANAELDDRYARKHTEVDAGQYVMISLTDTGTGMPPDVIERAFDPFYTTKEPGKGTGLGLSQVYGYVKQSRGHVAIYSEVDRGTAIKIYLPRHLGTAKDGKLALDAAAPIPQGSNNDIVLVVEDDEDVRHMTVDSLKELGYFVIAAASGKQALEQLDRQPRVDLLFTDIVMQEMNGRQLADMAIAKAPGIKILYTTGYTRNAVVHNGVLDHGVSLLAKPFTLEQLAHKLREVLDGATQSRR
ncbi:ATP-binding protein [Rhizobium tubonense]|uniref:histidine kinase n=1 Tax=Rhizobium tubonense TaxID=484088 RepID=A0A2W4CX86_9HYPH|nr:ATP-binding protein [Rhizobium tubonense]PZM16902.1 hybrid sensor histidine kinase/response regulator [Rhizobium tubonense]